MAHDSCGAGHVLGGIPPARGDRAGRLRMQPVRPTGTARPMGFEPYTWRDLRRTNATSAHPRLEAARRTTCLGWRGPELSHIVLAAACYGPADLIAHRCIMAAQWRGPECSSGSGLGVGACALHQCGPWPSYEPEPVSGVRAHVHRPSLYTLAVRHRGPFARGELIRASCGMVSSASHT